MPTVGDPDLELLARDVPMTEIEAAVARHSPDVVLLNFGTLSAPAEVLRLHQHSPAPGSWCWPPGQRPRSVTRCCPSAPLAARGKHVLPRSAAANGRVERLGERGAHLLTARETEVLELLQDGFTNGEVASELSIGIETVRTHARSVYRELGVASRRELARMARQEAVVVDDERRVVTS